MSVAIVIGLVALWAVVAVALNEGERKRRRSEMGLSPTPSPLSELRAEHNERVERALERAAIAPLPEQALGHTRIGLDDG